MRGICLNWKVVAVLGAASLGLWALAPQMLTQLAPVLLVLACPLSMLFMMRSGSQQGGTACAMPNGKNAVPGETVHATPSPFAGSREAQVAQLKADLAQAREHQESIAYRLAELDSAESPAARAVREAEGVAVSAERRYSSTTTLPTTQA